MDLTTNRGFRVDVFWEVFWEGIGAMDEYTTKTWGTYTGLDEYPIGSMYAIYGNMHLINIPQSC